MDFKVIDEAIKISNTVLDSSSEQPIDLDVVLPDYCPDISRILKCTAAPKIDSRQKSGDKLLFDGNVKVKIIYLCEEARIHCFEQSMPFSAQFDARDVPEYANISHKIKLEYLNCRAVNQRKLDIHGAFVISVRATADGENVIVTDAEGCGVQLRKIACPVTNTVGDVSRSFVVSETLNIPNERQPVESIIRSEAVADMDDFKVIANKIITKGEIMLKLLYISDMANGSMDSAVLSIPVSQIIDIEGVDDSCVCMARYEVADVNINIKVDNDGENRLLNAEIKINAFASAYKKDNVTLITDGYSGEYEIIGEKKTVSVDNIIDVIRDKTSVKNYFDMPDEGVTRIIDVWCDIMSVNTIFYEKSLKISGQMNVCMLVLDMNAVPLYFERMIDYEHIKPIDDDCQSLYSDADAAVLSTEFSISSSGKIEVETRMLINASVFSVDRYQAINAIVIDENRKREPNKAALTLYYADMGEEIWNIAKKYGTAVDAILKENNLTEDVISEHGMILIPIQ